MRQDGWPALAIHGDKQQVRCSYMGGVKTCMSDDEFSTFGCGSDILMHNGRFLLILRLFVGNLT
eukprot:759280-Hanusia_phi.AAC.2